MARGRAEVCLRDPTMEQESKFKMQNSLIFISLLIYLYESVCVV